MNCFTALKEEFLDEWKDPSRNVLWKTTGYGAIIKALPFLYKKGIDFDSCPVCFFTCSPGIRASDIDIPK